MSLGVVGLALATVWFLGERAKKTMCDLDAGASTLREERREPSASLAPSGIHEEPSSPREPSESGASPKDERAASAPDGTGTIVGHVKLADGSLPSADALANSSVFISVPGYSPRLTDDWTFTIDHLKPGDPLVVVRVQGFVTIQREPRVEAGRISNLELVLSPEATFLSGRVVDEHGTPLSQASVIAVVKRSDGGSDGLEIGVDEDGSFSFTNEDLAAGTIDLTARCDGLDEAKVSLGTLREGELRTGIELVLEQGNRVAGRVVQPQELSIASVQLQIFDETEKREIETKPDDDGRFVFTGLGPGPFRLWAWNVEEDDGPLRAVGAIMHVAPNTLDLVVSMDPPGSIELTIRGLEGDRTPDVEVVDLDGRRASPPQDPLDTRPSVRVEPTENRVAITDIWPGEYGLRITDFDHERVALARVSVHAGESIHAEVVLEPACSLQVSVLEDGEAINRGSILARADDGFCYRFGQDEAPVMRAHESGSLMYSIGVASLPPGHYAIVAECDGKRASSEVTLLLGSDSEITLELQ